MFQLTKNLSTRHGQELKQEIEKFSTTNPKIKCKALNCRPVFLTKYLAATENRKDKNRRRKVFLAAIELIRKRPVGEFTSSFPVVKEIELNGLTPNREIVFAHIREEKDPSKNDRQLFLISTFYKEPK